MKCYKGWSGQSEESEDLNGDQLKKQPQDKMKIYNFIQQELITRLKNLVYEFDDNFSEGSSKWAAIKEAKELLSKLNP